MRHAWRWLAVVWLLLASLMVAAGAAQAAPPLGRWSELAPLPTGRYSLAAATGADGRIYALGGFNGRYGSGYLTTAEVYTPAINTWAAAAPMPTPREFFAAVGAPDGRIFALGGVNNGGPSASWQVLSTVDVYDP